MAVKAPRKKTVVRGAPRTKRGTKAGEFDWAGWESWSPAKFHTQRRHADIDAVKAVTTGNISPIVCSLSRCLLNGMPDVHEEWNKYWISLAGTGDTAPRPASAYIDDEIRLLIPQGKRIIKEKKAEDNAEAATTTPTIQDRIIDQSIAANEEIDEWLEGFIVNSKTFDRRAFNGNA
jgi:hypothetical protein